MYIWFLLGAFFAGIYYLLDLAIRRRRWKNNTVPEKRSLALGMACMPFFAFFSYLGLFLGITGDGDGSFFGVLYSVSLYMGAAMGVISLACVIASLILRRQGKAAASGIVSLAALGYCFIVVILYVVAGAFV